MHLQVHAMCALFSVWLTNSNNKFLLIRSRIWLHTSARQRRQHQPFWCRQSRAHKPNRSQRKCLNRKTLSDTDKKKTDITRQSRSVFFVPIGFTTRVTLSSKIDGCCYQFDDTQNTIPWANGKCKNLNDTITMNVPMEAENQVEKHRSLAQQGETFMLRYPFDFNTIFFHSLLFFWTEGFDLEARMKWPSFCKLTLDTL